MCGWSRWKFLCDGHYEIELALLLGIALAAALILILILSRNKTRKARHGGKRTTGL